MARDMNTSALVVTVVFDIKPDCVGDFRKAILENAALSEANEPGCLLFDVAEHPERPTFFLYELYRDAAAFEAHLASTHFQAFNTQSADWVVDKTLGQYTKLAKSAA